MTTGTPPPSPRPRRRRSLLPLAVAVWLVLEIWLLTEIADAAGGVAVLLLLLVGLVVGVAVVKQAGRRAFDNLAATLREQQGGAVAGRESRGSGNGLLMLAGILLIVPGPLSDVAGLALLIPPVRKLVRRRSERFLERRVRAATPGGLGDAYRQSRIHQPDGKVVQGEVVRDEPGGREEQGGPRGPEDSHRPLGGGDDAR